DQGFTNRTVPGIVPVVGYLGATRVTLIQNGHERLTTMKFPSRLIQFWPLERLIPYENNPRTHSHKQVKQIARSLKKFGFVNPLIVDENSGLLAGHGRLLAARQLGLTEVPVIAVDHLTEIEKRAYILADNKLALNADWDDQKLREVLATLQKELF